MDSHDSDGSQVFVTRLTAFQQSLYALIRSLAPNGNDAWDILAETNLVLWKKRGEYDSNRDFGPWACQFAKYQVLAFRKQQQRDRLIFKEDVIELLAVEAESLVLASDRAARASLDSCLEKLNARNRNLLRRHYWEGCPLGELAEETNRTVGAIRDLLYRVRLQLAGCIQRILK
jgi:RNA polymerase sigma-70 factor (ECF subfamily)